MDVAGGQQYRQVMVLAPDLMSQVDGNSGNYVLA